MKKMLRSFALILLCFTLFGCNAYKTTTNQRKIDNAIKMALNHYNSTVKDTPDIKFPTTMKSGNIITKKIETGRPQGTPIKLDMSVIAVKQNTQVIVTLTKDYNIMINGTKAISYWKYEITNNHIKLLDKKEDGRLVNIMK